MVTCYGSNRELIHQEKHGRLPGILGRPMRLGFPERWKLHTEISRYLQSPPYTFSWELQWIHVTKIFETQEEVSTRTGGSNTQHSTQLWIVLAPTSRNGKSMIHETLCDYTNGSYLKNGELIALERALFRSGIISLGIRG